MTDAADERLADGRAHSSCNLSNSSCVIPSVTHQTTRISESWAQPVLHSPCHSLDLPPYLSGGAGDMMTSGEEASIELDRSRAFSRSRLAPRVGIGRGWGCRRAMREGGREEEKGKGGTYGRGKMTGPDWLGTSAAEWAITRSTAPQPRPFDRPSLLAGSPRPSSFTSWCAREVPRASPLPLLSRGLATSRSGTDGRRWGCFDKLRIICHEAKSEN